MRWKAPYVVDLKASRLGRTILTSDLTTLYEKTPYDKRLKANAEVLIRNHPFSKDDIYIRVNSDGFRGPETPKQKAQNEFRIFVLGDSLTLQDYLREEKLYLRSMERELNTPRKTQRVSVINGGNTDFGTKEELSFFLDRGLRTKPDLVVLEIYLNDSRPPWGLQGQIGIDRQSYVLRASLVLTRLYMGVKLFQWGQTVGFEKFSWSKEINKINWKHQRAAFLNLAKAARYGWGAAWEPDSWVIIDQQLALLKKLSAENRFRVLVVAFPVSFQVNADYVEDAPQRLLKDKVSKLDFEYLDLLPVLRENRNLNLFFDECHLTESANDIIGREIAGAVQKNKYLTG